MSSTSLTSLSPLEGRYHKKLEPLRKFLSEYGLIKYRVFVEITWFQALTKQSLLKELPSLSVETHAKLNDFIEHFNLEQAKAVKKIESTTKHDVKAVEYFLKDTFAKEPELAHKTEFIHFACTSEDINNLAYSLMLSDTLKKVLLPKLSDLIAMIKAKAKDYQDLAMLSRTHGQPASPTTLGKEFANFFWRLQKPYQALKSIKIQGKINGAVGNFNAHQAAYPELNWLAIAQQYVESLGLDFNPLTTQIEPHDHVAEVFHYLSRINTILMDFNRDIWLYISLNYFKQKIKTGQVGSSTMPHKINPIQFENAEGNLGIANALLNHLANKLPLSRLQRDLTDSTVLRNLGNAIGHSFLAYENTLTGLNTLEANEQALYDDLGKHWEILAEPIQTVMRRYGQKAPYEKLKSLTQGKTVDKQILHHFIDTLNLPNSVKDSLKLLTPWNYLGIAKQLTQLIT